MRKIISFLLLIHTGFLAYSQSDWPKAGATWYYEYGTVNSSGYIKLTLGDTKMIAGKLCQGFEKRIYYSTLGAPGVIIRDSTDSGFIAYYTYTQNDSVFYIDDNNQFRLLYDFNATTSDTWQIGTNNPCLTRVKVDSTGAEIINGKNLKWIATSLDSNAQFNYYGKVMERIGGVGIFLFPQESACIIDAAEAHGLRCYYDDSIGWYNKSGKPCDYLVTGIENFSGLTKPTIYPKLANTAINVKFAQANQRTINLYAMNGQLLKSIEAYDTEVQIDIENLKNGMIMVEVRELDGKITVDKFVKAP